MEKRERLKRAREAAKLSQKALADLVGTSQQQIQRIEAGHTIRLGLATQIAAILRTELEVLFPEIRAAARKLRKARKLPEQEYVARAQEDLGRVGFDADPVTWTIILRMRSGLKREYIVSSMDAARLQKCIDNNASGFVSFDSQDAEVSVAWSHVLMAHFLWDGPGLREPSPEDQAPTIKVWFHHPEPMTFEVEYEEDSADVEEQGPIRNFLFGLDLGTDADEPFATFDDIDGERVSLRVADIEILEGSFAIFRVPSDDDDDQGPPTLDPTDASPVSTHGN